MVCAYERYVQNVTAGLYFNDKAMKTVNKLGRASLTSGAASREERTCCVLHSRDEQEKGMAKS